MTARSSQERRSIDIAQQVLTAGFESLAPNQVRIFEAKLREILNQVAAE
jgi:hypothetical protein